MDSSQDMIRELEIKRRALNERLMNAKDVAEANGIERELWAIRARMRYHKSMVTKGGTEKSRFQRSATSTRKPSRFLKS